MEVIMFNSLSQRLLNVLDKLKKRGFLSENDVNDAMREMRIALLEADVALPVVKDFIETAKEKAIGQEIIKSINPAQMVVKIVHDQLIEKLGKEVSSINLFAPAPFSILMAGLQGSGKTTSTAKLAKYIRQKYGKKILLVSLDIYRPAAQEQLETLAKQLEIISLPIVKGEKPLDISKRALALAKTQGFDLIIFDSAGRLHIDSDLMAELKNVKDLIKPLETFLVADAMTGQDAVVMAKAFNESLGLTGIILTRIDGDSRGGSALSMRHVTSCPIKFLGVGEKVDQLEVFDPKRLADRILDMGDILSLVEKAAEIAEVEDAEKLAKKLKKGQFDFNDMAQQIIQMQKMGGLSSLMSMIPGLGQIKNAVQGVNDKVIMRQLAIIRSMTLQERVNYQILNASRKRRIASGAGVEVMEINRLLKHLQHMQKMTKHLGKVGEKRFLKGNLFN